MANFNSQGLSDGVAAAIQPNTVPAAVPTQVLSDATVSALQAGTFSVAPVQTAQLLTLKTATYRLRGYYVAGSAYEFWIGTSIDTPPPSGHTLVNKSVDAVLG